MQGRAVVCLLSGLAISACGERPPADPPANARTVAAVQIPQYCGGSAAPGVIDGYFRRLGDHLAASDAPVPMSFYAERFGITADGRQLWFKREDFQPGARQLPTTDDWREISRRWSGELHSVGYRGCMLAHGKVWFESNGDEFSLISFNKEMPWGP